MVWTGGSLCDHGRRELYHPSCIAQLCQAAHSSSELLLAPHLYPFIKSIPLFPSSLVSQAGFGLMQTTFCTHMSCCNLCWHTPPHPCDHLWTCINLNSHPKPHCSTRCLGGLFQPQTSQPQHLLLSQSQEAPTCHLGPFPLLFSIT